MEGKVVWELVKRHAQITKDRLSSNLLAFAVFGSMARREAKFPESDIDLLIILKDVTGTMGKRIEMLSEIERELEKTDEYRNFVNKYKWRPVFQEHVLNEKELSLHPPLLLDLVQDAVIIYDTGILKRELRVLEEKLKKLGARRIKKGKDRFWILKPDIKPGEVIDNLNTEIMARDYLKRAKRCLIDAENAFNDSDHPMSVRRAQECVEMSLKAILRAFGIEYPKKHDVGDALNLIAEKVPEWFLSKLPHVKEISKDLAKKRGPAMYGYELELKPAFEIFDEDDAVKAISSAKEVFELCNRLISEIFRKNVL